MSQREMRTPTIPDRSTGSFRFVNNQFTVEIDQPDEEFAGEFAGVAGDIWSEEEDDAIPANLSNISGIQDIERLLREEEGYSQLRRDTRGEAEDADAGNQQGGGGGDTPQVADGGRGRGRGRGRGTHGEGDETEDADAAYQQGGGGGDLPQVADGGRGRGRGRGRGHGGIRERAGRGRGNAVEAANGGGNEQGAGDGGNEQGAGGDQPVADGGGNFNI